ncbi:tetratricopeptide repeat protein [Pontiella desulfatans]|uniref:hypothetical protein n=1 Tax=Pontiella desulfatans TaxID=2750659 RepID=UPI001443CBBC|nr:hypothetical protein [Pontiella desulfatans]
MNGSFNMEYVGKSKVVSHANRCSECRRLKVLSSYATTRFIHFYRLPLLPWGQYYIMDECPHCGHRGVISLKKHTREHKKQLALMVDGFSSNEDDPEVCCHALQTLMVFDEAIWFNDVRRSHAARFETSPKIQHLIAKGLCRFGDYEQSMQYARKAIVLGAGKEAEELLEFCHRLKESLAGSPNLGKQAVQPETAFKAYVPLLSVATFAAAFIVMQGMVALRSHRAWIVNGSLQEYSVVLDTKSYTLASGERRQVKLKLGAHELRMEGHPNHQFTYGIPLFRQLLEKHLLVINPDAMAVLTIQDEAGDGGGSTYCFGQKVHGLSSVGHPLFSFNKKENEAEVNSRVNLFRPQTHMAVVDRLNQLGFGAGAQEYARRALAMNPATAEVVPLLRGALDGATDEEVASFLMTGCSVSPALLPWHLHYQDHFLLAGSGNRLLREYTAWCKQHPDDPAGFYLLGRVMENHTDARKFFIHSEKGQGMGGLGYHAVASDLVAHGEYGQALAYAQKAVAADPANDDFRNVCEQTLMALRNYDVLLHSTPVDSFEAASLRVLSLTLAGYHREAEEFAIDFSNRSPQWLSALNAVRYYAVGNTDAYLGLIAEAGDPSARFRQLIHAGQIPEADMELTKDENHAWWEHLVFYCAAMQQKQFDLAQLHYEKAVDEVGGNSLSERRMAGLLASDTPPELDQITGLHVDASEKALLCMALGHRFPGQDADFRKLARKYNIFPVYPQLLVRQWSREVVRDPAGLSSLEAL